MKAVEIKGIIPPILTPMNDDESINVAELRNQVDRMIEGGVHALFPFGTNGEGYILNAKEKQLVLETVIEQCNGRVPVYAGTGCISTKETIEQSRMAQAAGADVLSIITPSFAAASQDELYEHYRAVAKAVDMPIVLYNIPARTGNALAPATVGRLAQIENIVAAKEASGNFSLLAHTRHLCGDDFYIWSGNDDQVVPMMSLGAKGVISVASNIIPEVMVKMTHLCLDNDFASASKLQIEYMDLIDALFCDVNPIPVKEALNLLGMEAGPVRLPLCEMEEKNKARLRAAMQAKGLL